MFVGGAREESEVTPQTESSLAAIEGTVLREVTKRFGSLAAVHDVELDIVDEPGRRPLAPADTTVNGAGGSP